MRTSLLPLLLALVLLGAAACGGESDPVSDAAESVEESTEASDAGSDEAAPADSQGDAVEVDGKPEVPLPDGPVTSLVIEDLIVGEGDPAESGDNVVVNYVGVLASDGTEFDASWNRGQTFDFQLGQGNVIPGWDQGVVGMAPGGRRVLTIPSDLAYGANGQGSIPGDAALVFVVDLVSAMSPDDEVSALFDDGRERPVPSLPEGVVTELGIIEVIDGTGEVAETGDLVDVHYVGVFNDGVEFDASWSRGAESFQFVLGEGMVIEGWDNGVVGMAVGGRRQLWIPYEAAYGADGRPPSIPAESDLVFVVDLLKVTKRISEDAAPELVLPDSVSGELEVTDVVDGTGPELGAGDTAEVHFILQAFNTQVVIDSSYERGFPVPLEIGTGRLFPGFEQGLTGMQVGGRRLLVIPPDLAFGDDGVEPDIGPGETLVILVDLISIS